MAFGDSNFRFSIHVIFCLVSYGYCLPPEVTFGLIFNGNGSSLDQSQLKPPIDIAIEMINEGVRDGSYLNFSITSIVGESSRRCSPSVANFGVGLFSQMVQENRIHVLFGHVCSFEMIGMGDLAAFRNVPSISGGATASDFDNKVRFSTLTRTAHKSDAIANLLSAAFGIFKWRRCAMLIRASGYFTLVSPAIEEELRVKKNYTLNKVVTDNFESSREALSVAISEARGMLI